jgi:CelD/BcsL family acetyltransferase involved in cellulose biosynthesis
LKASVGKVFDNACLPVTGDWESYYKQRKKKERWRLRRLAQKLGENYQVDCEEFTDLDRIEGATGSILEVEARSWKAVQGVPINDPQYNNFYFELAKVLSRAGWLRLFVLKADGKPIAYQYYVHYQGSVTALNMSYDRSFDQFGPGMLLIALALERLFRDGVSQVDLLWGNLDFKRKWADELHPRHEICVYGKDLYSRFIMAILTNKSLRRTWRYWREFRDRFRQGTG